MLKRIIKNALSGGRVDTMLERLCRRGMADQVRLDCEEAKGRIAVEGHQDKVVVNT